MVKLVSFVGTSILTNYFKNIGKAEKDQIEKILSDYEKNPNESLKREVENIKRKLTEWLMPAEETLTEKSLEKSAELTSIDKIIDLYKDKGKIKCESDICLYIVPFDNFCSQFFSEILGKFLKKYYKSHVEVKERIKGLQVREKEIFERDGIINLVDFLSEIASDGKTINFGDMVLNITGGYKAIIPYLTLIGQIHNIPLYYIFEDRISLLKIPQAPVDFDYLLIEENLDALEELYKNKIMSSENFDKYLYPSHEKELKKEELEKSSVLHCTNEGGQKRIELTSIGRLLIDKYKGIFDQQGIGSPYETTADERVMNRGEIINHLIELKLFEYFVGKGYSSVEHSVNGPNYEIDILIYKNEMYKIVEVKRANSNSFRRIAKKQIGLFKENNDKGFGTFSNFYKECLIDKCDISNVSLHFYLYETKDKQEDTKFKEMIENKIKWIKNLIKKKLDNHKFKELYLNSKWNLVFLPKNYKCNLEWKIEENDIYEINTNNYS